MTGLTIEQREIRQLAREFAQGELLPRSGAWDADRALDLGVFAQLGELGFLGMRVPERYGGLALDTPTYLTALEQIARGDASVALVVSAHSGPVVDLLTRRGSDEQKSLWLPQLAGGRVMGGLALSAARAASAPASLNAVAERDGDAWRIRGTLDWVLNGARAKAVAVAAQTGEDSVGIFLLDSSQSGYEVTRRESTLGLRATEIVGVELDVRVAAECVLGEPDRSLDEVRSCFDIGLLGIAAQSLGIASAALEHAVAYALERRQFGRPIAEFGAIQEKLASLAARIEAARVYVLHVAARLDAVRGGSPDPDASAELGVAAACASAKLLASELAMSAADEAVQIFGGYGYMREYPVEQLMRDAKGTEILEGTSEFMRIVIAEDVLFRGSGNHHIHAGHEST